ncbi:NAD(P)-dependent oxidoreductase [Amycolatopsis mongoliensis]|uniref:NAD(P)-dependent oxidoreductase n=1 Tax=Amycolatopsis mongoliensis TaxID=715475 RepID=A0A9Y2JKL0_9PSEU|nr:NAD(P)-dependent oxidoreductase [Amycolatopsis sp. 4-36]WIX99106.1 NAD(P)-dependent oxidoreductase [Amycolatopsis sp. 4-36]
MGRVLVTGAAGRVGRIVVPGLRRELRLLDLAPTEELPGEWVTGSVTDAATMAEACAGVDAVIHLAGIAGEDTWDRLMDVNVGGTRTVLDAALVAGVSRVVLASSVHAVGYRPAGHPVPADCPPCPDTFYGMSKAVVEALGSLHHSRFGLDVICVRIGSCFARPVDRHALGLWLSPGDAGRLFEACLTAVAPGFRIIWGVSANTRGRCSLAEGEELGYHPVDDSERFAATLPPDSSVSAHLGGTLFTTAELGRPL